MPTASVCVVLTTERMRRPPAEIVPIPGRSTWKRFWLTLGKRPGSPVREVPSRLPKSQRNYVDALDAEKRPSEAIAEVVEAAQVPEWDGNAGEGWLPIVDTFRTLCLAPPPEIKRMFENLQSLPQAG